MKRLSCALFQAGDIACIIGDDSDHGSGLIQYSGLWTLVSRHKIHTAIAPPYAGLLAGVHRGTRPLFSRVDDSTARLEKVDERSGMESEATFTVSSPLRATRSSSTVSDAPAKTQMHEPSLNM